MYSDNVNCFTEDGPFKWEWSYRYSPGGERESKRLTTSPIGDGLSSHNWNYYLLGGNKQQLAVYNGRETSRTDCYSSGNRVYFYPTEYLTYGNGSSALLTTRANGNQEYKVTDHLGSTRVVVDSTGYILSQYDYEPFGKPLAKTGLDSRKSYIDKEKDYESGLGDFGVRKFDDGRFTSIDPLWEKFRAWSPYQYGYDNPLRMFDPSGMAGIEPWHGDDNRAKDTRPQTKTDLVQDEILTGIGLHTNKVEREWMRNNPLSAAIVSDNMILAKGFVQNNKEKMGLSSEEHNTNTDGVRHVVWSALNATTIGEIKAREIADAHEMFYANPSNEESMDRHNNEVGFKIASTIKKLGIHQDNPFYIHILTKLVMDSYNSGNIQKQPK